MENWTPFKIWTDPTIVIPNRSSIRAPTVCIFQRCAVDFVPVIKLPASSEGPKVTVNFLSACKLSSRVRGKSNQRLRVMLTWRLRPKISIELGTRATSWLPSRTRTPTMTWFESLLFTSNWKPPGLVLAMYSEVVCKKQNCEKIMNECGSYIAQV